ncbi:MAG: DciA family protein [Acidimicrobiales bacterium]
MGEPRTLGASLDALARSLGAPDATCVPLLFASWDDIVGASLARHTWPLSVSASGLLVATDHPGWATELRYKEGEVLTALRDKLGYSPAGIQVSLRAARRDGE